MTRVLCLLTFIVFTGSLGRAGAVVKQMPLLIMPTENAARANKDFSDHVLPKSLTEADTSQTVVSKMIDNSLSYWWDNSELKNTSVGQAATKIEENMKTEMALGTSGDAKTEHKLNLKVLAMQALAKIEYSGWFKAAVNYDARAARAEMEVMENLSNDKDLVISHSITANENKSQLSLRWNW